jgi:Cu/Ag efflux protein CusF
VVDVRPGEQVRFEIFNEGSWNHEFVLASEAANRKHAELMKKFPDMEHADPNAVRLSPFASGAILWKFTRRGAFQFDMDEGMTMVYRAADPAMLHAVKPGDKIKFAPDRVNGQFTVTKIEKAK